MGLFEQLREDVRASDAAAVLANIGVTRLGQDDRYWQSYSYAFHLHYADGTTEVFPLVLNPTQMHKSHPFTVELTPTQEGGVVAEENGIIISDLTINGNTGVRPRVNANQGGPPLALSGQAHFLWLQDSCFFAYSKLKKDPKVAAQTYMSWHNYRDGEHWLCVPRSITLDRSQGRNFYYNYSIQVSLIGEIEQASSRLDEEDRDLFTSMKDSIRNISQSVASIQSVNLDIQNFESAISRTTAAVLNNVAIAVGAINDFVTGLTTFIRLPQRSILQLADDIDAVMALADPTKVLSIPYDYTAAWLEMQDGLLRVAAYPEKFKEDFSAAGQRFLRLTTGPGKATQAELDAAASGTITQAADFETSALRPGDATRVAAGLFDLRLKFPHYLGFRETVVLFGDSLPGIAARELSDARRWMDLAIANGLQAPYISEEGLPFTLRPGAPILIPTTAATPPADTVRSAGNPADSSSQLEALFGRDFQLTQHKDGSFDFVVDPASSTDFSTVAGTNNIEQAISTILSTEKGAYLMHLNVGVARIVGKPGTVERVVEARSRIVEAVQRDPRIAKVKNASFKLEKDALAIGIEAETVDASPLRVIGRVIS
jgi:phage baseplate assembly protein W